MRFLKAFALAFAMGAALVSTPALAQPSQASGVMVVNYERIIADTDAGRSLTTQLQTIATAMQSELRPEGTAIETEETAIRTAIGNRTPEQIRSDSALSRRIEALQRRAEAFRQRQVTTGRDLEYTRQQAFNGFNEQITPIVRELMESRGVSVALDAGAANLVLPAADATPDVISRVNQRVRTFSVTRRQAPAQAAGAAPAQSGNRH
jgi:Skp family chaperone for outer membrane proteins